MSYERGWNAMNLKMTDTIPHTEAVDHPELVKHITGIQNVDWSNYDEFKLVMSKFYQLTDYDFLWSVHHIPNWPDEKITNMGHASYKEDSSDYDNDIRCPYKTPEDVLNFDPIKELGVPDVDELSKKLEEIHHQEEKENPALVMTNGWYRTLFSACIQVFGWDMFLLSAGLDYKKFDKVLEGFFQISSAVFSAWSKTSLKVCICHDDIVWSHGPVFHPDWYRKYIFPRYKKMWKPLKEKGIKIIFTSDANNDEFIDDIFEAGADGLEFEPWTSLEKVVAKYGKTKIIVGNVDCRILTFGKKEDIYREVKRCVDLGRDCPGYFISVSNQIPHNVPFENALYYFDLIKELGKR